MFAARHGPPQVPDPCLPHGAVDGILKFGEAGIRLICSSPGRIPDFEDDPSFRILIYSLDGLASLAFFLTFSLLCCSLAANKDVDRSEPLWQREKCANSAVQDNGGGWTFGPGRLG